MPSTTTVYPVCLCVEKNSCLCVEKNVKNSSLVTNRARAVYFAINESLRMRAHQKKKKNYQKKIFFDHVNILDQCTHVARVRVCAHAHVKKKILPKNQHFFTKKMF